MFAHKEISHKVCEPTCSENAQHLLVWLYRERCAYVRCVHILYTVSVLILHRKYIYIYIYIYIIIQVFSNSMKYHDHTSLINHKNLSLSTLNLLRYNLLILFLNDEECSIVLISSGRQFYRSTLWLDTNCE